jgi:hypothetical protein
MITLVIQSECQELKQELGFGHYPAAGLGCAPVPLVCAQRPAMPARVGILSV